MLESCLWTERTFSLWFLCPHQTAGRNSPGKELRSQPQHHSRIHPFIYSVVLSRKGRIYLALGWHWGHQGEQTSSASSTHCHPPRRQMSEQTPPFTVRKTLSERQCGTSPQEGPGQDGAASWRRPARGSRESSSASQRHKEGTFQSRAVQYGSHQPHVAAKHLKPG